MFASIPLKFKKYDYKIDRGHVKYRNDGPDSHPFSSKNEPQMQHWKKVVGNRSPLDIACTIFEKLFRQDVCVPHKTESLSNPHPNQN